MSFAREALAVERWPNGDRDRWTIAIAADDPLEDPGAAAGWRKTTLRTVLTRYGLWLAWLLATGRLDVAATPTKRATPDNLAAYLHDLRERGIASFTIVGRFRDLREALRVMELDADLGALDRLLIRLEAAATPTRPKRLAVLSPVDLLEAAIQDLKYHQRLQDRAQSRRTAERSRDALMVAFLATRPLRLSNFASIGLGQNLVRQDHRFWCRFQKTETKDGRHLEFPLPDVLTPWLDRYLGQHRPLLLREQTFNRLWISMRSTPMQDNSIYYRVVHVTRRLMGRPVNPHLFRDCAATFIAEEAPEQVLIISQILGHSTLATAEDHYNQAGMLSAQMRYLEALRRCREDPAGEHLVTVSGSHYNSGARRPVR